MRTIQSLLYILILSYQAVAQLPDNLNLIADIATMRNAYLINDSGYCFTKNENSCWMQANKSCFARISGDKGYIDTTTVSWYLSYNCAEALWLGVSNFSYDKKNRIYFDTMQDYRLYAQTKFITTLTAGRRYYFSAMAGIRRDSLNSNITGWHTIGQIGFCLSKNKVYDTNNNGRINLSPNFNFAKLTCKKVLINEYIPIKFSFVSNGSEEYLTIGNFDYFSHFDTLQYILGSNANERNDSIFNAETIITLSNISLVSDTSIEPTNINVLDLGNDTTICDTNNFVLSAPNYYNSYLWNTGETTGSIMANKTGIYSCIASLGCGLFIDSIFIERCKIENNTLTEIIFPNIFTPNADGLNDYFKPLNFNFDIHHLKVFNRYGQLIYNSSTNFSWDGYHQGYPCETGTYFYMIQYESKITNKVEIAKGEINLIR